MQNDASPPKANPVLTKSFDFSVSIVLFCKKTSELHREYILTKQLLKSGTSIGANIEEAQSAQSKRDFIAKMSISHKEATETHYWLRVLLKTQIGDPILIQKLMNDCSELIFLLTSILKSSKNNL